MFHVDHLAGKCQVGQGQAVSDEVLGAAQCLLQVVEVRRQLFRQSALHCCLIAGLAHGRLQGAVAKYAEGTEWRQLVVAVFLQPAHTSALLGIAAQQGCAFRVVVFKVLADHAGVGQAEIAVLQCRDTAQRVEFAIPGGLAEGQNDFQAVLEVFLRQAQAYFAYEGRERRAIDC
ncbi:hypothetical protein D3C84_568450 [compost metagenome]